MTAPDAERGKIEHLLDALAEVDRLSLHEIRYELRCLHAWRDVATKHLGYSVGDRVAIRGTWDPPRENGWGPYWECMMPGQVGEVLRFEINPGTCRITAVTRWDTEWSVHPARRTDGADGPHRFSCLVNYKREPEDRRHVYYFPAEHLRLATDDDRALVMPS